MLPVSVINNVRKKELRKSRLMLDFFIVLIVLHVFFLIVEVDQVRTVMYVEKLVWLCARHLNKPIG